jgi:hypothetical protein
MSTITAVLESDEDGTLHLPLPRELRGKKLRVTATLVETAEGPPDPKRGTKTVLEALEELRKRGGLGDIIPDPVAWQREQRKDRTLWPEP